MTAAPVVLGFDSAPTKLGWGAVTEEGEPVACGVHPLDGSPEAVADALSAISRSFTGEPLVAYIEDVSGQQLSYVKDAAVTIGYLEANLRRFWPGLQTKRIYVQSWRSAVMLRAPKGGAKLAAMAMAAALGFTHGGSDDAAEGALIAHCAYLHLCDGTIRRMAA